MAKTNKNFIFLIVILAVGFIAGILLAAPLGISPRATIQEQTVTPEVSRDNSQVHDLLNQISKAFEESAANVSASVVSIFAEQTVQTQSPFGLPDDAFKDFFGEDFFRRFFGTPAPRDEKRTVRSLGSGVIVTKDGYILTNNHVVANAEKLSVVIGDNKTYEAKVIGTDPPTDVAVIKVNANNLPAAKLGNSNDVKVGQWVIAVGNPFQLFHTVTHGIISAKGRSSVGLADYEDFFQTDASINPGNSGGALADMEGYVIGINTAIASPSGGNVGIGFAIPINMAKKVMEDLISKGEVTRGYIGLVPQDINEDLAKALKLSGTEGVLVGDVDRAGPADKGGIRRGDVIVEFDGKKVETSTQLRNMAAQANPGTPVKIGLLRDGKKVEVKVTLGERPKESAGSQAPQEPQAEAQTSQKLGLSVQTLTPDIAEQLGYQKDSGVIVTDVFSGSPAEEAGLQRGDLIKEVNRKEVRTVQDFEKEINDLKSGDVVALLVRRGQNTFFTSIKAQ
ncbi:MAG TPA: DegQ family serine endoprotease [Candidatus Heimdallarchaeota archaeon]|nr:DegQ family serine endoprotease [Candidatus Heimdallarchaeota archaeon]